MTLREAVELTKCRKGAAYGTTSDGAYWLAVEPIEIRRYGDGWGTNPSAVSWYLELRHFRGGEVRPTLYRQARHECSSFYIGDDYFGLPEIAELSEIEDIIVALKSGVEEKYDTPTGYLYKTERCYSDAFHDALVAVLQSLGMQYAASGPDETPAV